LPLPKFSKQRVFGSGGMISAYQGNLTIDGLYLEGSESSVQMSTVSQGIAIMVGSNTKILNNEIVRCDIGMMLSGTESLVQGNYVHDLRVVVDAPPGVDPNLVGGAEGIFGNGSNNEVSYNTFIDCSDYAQWTGGDCDGGATEVAVPAGVGGTVSGLKIHHNFALNTCGFFEASSMGALVGVGGGISDAGSSAPKGLFVKGTTAKDYDLLAKASDLIDKGTPLTEVTLDFLNRTVPDSASGRAAATARSAEGSVHSPSG